MSGGSPEAESKEQPVDDLPRSHSSTIAGKSLGQVQYGHFYSFSNTDSFAFIYCKKKVLLDWICQVFVFVFIPFFSTERLQRSHGVWGRESFDNRKRRPG